MGGVGNARETSKRQVYLTKIYVQTKNKNCIAHLQKDVNKELKNYNSIIGVGK